MEPSIILFYFLLLNYSTILYAFEYNTSQADEDIFNILSRHSTSLIVIQTLVLKNLICAIDFPLILYNIHTIINYQ